MELFIFFLYLIFILVEQGLKHLEVEADNNEDEEEEEDEGYNLQFNI